MTDKPVALVTGGSMGLGLAVAEHLAQTMKVLTCARHGEVTYTCDVSMPDEVERMVKDIAKLDGCLDVLVCNAAIYGPVGQLDEIDWDQWVDTIWINLMGTVQCCRTILPIMRKQGHGKIITLSGGGISPHPNTTAYNASKGGVLRFTEALARDLEGTGIEINAVAPGTLDTRMRLRSALPDDPAVNMRKAVDLIAWLASSASNGITGRVFSAIWDDWVETISTANLGPNDYRMRRVVP